jgi:hypothetical protein
MKIETVCFSETLVSTCESTRRHNPEQQHRQVMLLFHRIQSLRFEIGDGKQNMMELYGAKHSPNPVCT